LHNPSTTKTETTSILDINKRTNHRNKIEEVTAGLANSWAKILLAAPTECASIIADYIRVMKSEVNLSDSYRRDLIDVLTKLLKFHKNKA
jgi:hypothetical protein